MITFIHTADVHLDAPLLSLADRYELRQYDFRLTMQKIRDLVLQKQADFWLIAGDLMEYHGGMRATALFLKELFASVDPVPVCIAPGNHDPWTEGSFYQTIDWPANVIFFTDEWGAYEFAEKSTVVYGWGFPNPHYADSPLQHFTGKLPGYQNHLMVVHGTVLTQDTADHQPYAPMQAAELLRCEMDYVALGHIHKPAQFLHPHRGWPFAAYPGSPEGLSAKEGGERFVLFGQVDETGRVALEPIPVQSRKITRLEMEIAGLETIESIVAHAEQIVGQHNPSDLFYITLAGERASHLTVPLEVLNARFPQHFHIQWEDKTWPDVDEEALLSENGIFGRWLRRLNEREKAATTDREREVIACARKEALKRIGGAVR